MSGIDDVGPPESRPDASHEEVRPPDVPLAPDEEAASEGPKAADMAPLSPAEEIRDEGSDGDLGGDGVPAGGGYDPVAAARADRAVIAEEITAITVNLARLLLAPNRQESPDERQAAERVMADTAQLLRIADELLSRGAGQDLELATAGTATMAVVKGDVKSARRRWPSAVWDRVWDEVKGISRRLWNMVAHLVKVKEWTVQGQAGTGILGLASVSVSVTFGS